MEVTLIPKTRHGKNRLESVRRDAPEWEGRWLVVDTQEVVKFLPGERGPWHRVEPEIDGRLRAFHARWVHATSDKNFSMQPNA